MNGIIRIGAIMAAMEKLENKLLTKYPKETADMTRHHRLKKNMKKPSTVQLNPTPK